MPLQSIDNRLLIGWHEWCSLPELGIPAIKAKIDTGARTSAIHAFNIVRRRSHGKDIVYFQIHPLQKNAHLTLSCKAPVIDSRYIMSSNGHKEERYVIETLIHLGDRIWPIEVTLSNRDPLMFRMLLGRTAMLGNVLIDPDHHSLQHKLSKSQLQKLYRQRSS